MFSRQFVRNFFCSQNLWSSVNKSDLAKLRKKTGYTFANCKKALEINKDLDSAEKWLKEQAQALGWSKAQKLQGRATLQGLVGVAMKGNVAVMVEVNCETDFVARNKKFQSLVQLATESCLTTQAANNTSQIRKLVLESDQLKSLPGPDGKNLTDHCALAIADLGENLNLRRALCFTSPENIYLSSYAHPNTNQQPGKVTMGKFGAIVAYQTDSNDTQRQQFARQICQHIIGMNPKKIGIPGEDEPSTVKDEEEIMIHQEFLLDPDTTVGQLISDLGINIIDFARLECGESLEDSEDPIPIRASG